MSTKELLLDFLQSVVYSVDSVYVNKTCKYISCVLSDPQHYQRKLHEAWNDYENATNDINDFMKICSTFYK